MIWRDLPPATLNLVRRALVSKPELLAVVEGDAQRDLGTMGRVFGEELPAGPRVCRRRTGPAMTELEIVERLRSRFGVTGRGVVLGIGDDCAIFRPVGSPQDLVFTTDQMIEGAHFRRGARPSWIGAKALARALSDIAAMAADPRFCLVSLAVPSSFRYRRFLPGLGRIAERFRILVAGGDLARSRSVSCDVVVCGSVPRGRALGATEPDRATPFTSPVPSDELPFANIGMSRSHESRAAEICEDAPRPEWISATAVARLTSVVPGFRRRRFSVQRTGGSRREPRTSATRRRRLRVVVYRPEFAWASKSESITDGPPGSVTFNGSLLSPGGWDHFA